MPRRGEPALRLVPRDHEAAGVFVARPLLVDDPAARVSAETLADAGGPFELSTGPCFTGPHHGVDVLQLSGPARLAKFGGAYSNTHGEP